ncbi:MAG: GGDEF domain-containing protein [Succinivibrio sp.]
MFDTNYLFIEIDIICLLVLSSIVVNLLKSGDLNRFSYIAVIGSVMLIALTDLGVKYLSSISCNQFLTQSGFCYSNNLLVLGISSLRCAANMLVVYVFFFITWKTGMEGSRTRDVKLLILSIPFIAMLWLIATTASTGNILFLTYYGNYINGRYYPVLVGTTGLYSVLSLINILRLMNEKRIRLGVFAESKFDLVLFYIICGLPFIGAPFNLFLNGTLSTIIYTLSFFFLMTLHQHIRISIDDLTCLNNRNELKSYLSNLMLLTPQERRKTFMMFIDLNKFKHINDHYGHNEGDEVLMQISKLLKTVAGNFNCFLCRYGGDEFILIKRNANEEKAVNVCRFIDRAVKNLRELSLAPYELSVSTGFVRFDNRFSTPQEFIDAADKLMYETKRSGTKDYNSMNK